jgi:hypothetical protein
MKAEEIVEEIKGLRETVNLAATRIVALSQQLYAHARRNASSDTASTAYVSFAGAWGRFAGAIQQGLRRTVIADRTLDRALGLQRDEQEAFERREASRRAQAEEKRRVKEVAPNPLRNDNPLRTLEGNSLDDLISLYGAGIVRDAPR